MTTNEIVENLMEFAKNPNNDFIDNFYDLSNEIGYLLQNITFTPEQNEQITNYINNRMYSVTLERDKVNQYY